MKFNIIETKIQGYLRKGSLLLTKEDLNINIKRHTRAHYVGISTISGCARMLWMKYFHPNLIKWPDNSASDHKSVRIFDMGHICEWITVRCLELGGATITGAQDTYEEFGIFKGHPDATIDGNLTGEIKSMNDNHFQHFVEQGVKKSHWGYYVQTQMYEYYSGTHDGCLIATNKNTGEMKCEHVPYDEAVVEHHRQKAKHISETKHFWDIDKEFIAQDLNSCSFCPLRKLCHGDKQW
ncbi:Cas4-domain exonuclease [Rhizobium phage RHph_TM30]|uniref:Putative exonuclease protein n=1 Tax=Rhizobium phage RHph_TM30 TaxID=2509764 RepID=A0A7S5UVJ6_9CAUD|nr:Cas4-domain exonuclease [Rhizobium phage RHph_TM30]QIG71403.1 putative exonuclease protein [Rhizobium phage RHph_TM30]